MTQLVLRLPGAQFTQQPAQEKKLVAWVTWSASSGMMALQRTTRTWDQDFDLLAAESVHFLQGQISLRFGLFFRLVRFGHGAPCLAAAVSQSGQAVKVNHGRHRR